MAHIQDRWETIVDGKRVRTNRYGQGKRWRARYLDPAGNERSKTFVRKQDAERFLTAVAADVLRGAYVDPDAGRITFAEFAARWLEAQTFGDSSREATELRLRLHACQHFGQRELRSIKPSVIQAWLRKLQQELAPSYVRTIFTNVSAVFSAAVDDGLIVTNPCHAKSVRLPKRDTEKVEPWTSAQVRTVIDALPRRYRAIAVVTAGCGLRQGEAFGLRVRDVDFLRRRVNVEQQVKLLGGRITIDKPKGGKTRAVPLPDTVAVEVAEHLRRCPASGDEARLHLAGAQADQPQPLQPLHLAPALDAAGIERSRRNGMHALRHFYASVLIDAGESARAVADYLGHADPGFTLRVYAHLFPSSEERARTAVDRAMDDGADQAGPRRPVNQQRPRKTPGDGPRPRDAVALTAPRRPKRPPEGHFPWSGHSYVRCRSRA
ncbi:MAG: site-specific integrase [Actinomycetota bacterium]|nr:site-specific integrase [Actinomycetota bacterium]